MTKTILETARYRVEMRDHAAYIAERDDRVGLGVDGLDFRALTQILRLPEHVLDEAIHQFYVAAARKLPPKPQTCLVEWSGKKGATYGIGVGHEGWHCEEWTEK